MNTNINGFLPENYELPKTVSRFTKFEDGETRIRILSNALVGWEYFDKENKSHKQKEKFEKTPGIKEKTQQREFWAFIIYNYRTEQIEVCQIHQVKIKEAILSLYLDPDYGDPKGYDLKISKTGKDLQTSYSLIPAPVKEISEEIKEAFLEEKIVLEALYENKNPFDYNAEKTEENVFNDEAYGIK